MTYKNHHRNKYLLLRSYIEQWLALPKMSRRVLAIEIVDKFFELGLDQALQIEDIFFARSGDPEADSSVNQQKIFRWLGIADDGAHMKVDKLFFIEPAIVAAMPEELRLHYDTDLKLGSGLRSSLQFNFETESGTRVDIISRMTKENAEAQISFIKLPEAPSTKQLYLVKREIIESLAVGQAALEHVEALIKAKEDETA